MDTANMTGEQMTIDNASQEVKASGVDANLQVNLNTKQTSENTAPHLMHPSAVQKPASEQLQQRMEDSQRQGTAVSQRGISLQHMEHTNADDCLDDNSALLPSPMARTSTDDLQMDMGVIHGQVTDHLWQEIPVPAMSLQQLASMTMLPQMQQQMAMSSSQITSTQSAGSPSTAYSNFPTFMPIALLPLLPAEAEKSFKSQTHVQHEAGNARRDFMQMPMPNMAADPQLAAAALQAQRGSQGQGPDPKLAAAALQAQRGSQGQGLPGDLAAGSSQTSKAWENVTTVMVRNIPNKYNQQLFMEDLKIKGFLGCYDFLYVPIDPGTQANRGYAFLNFTDAQFAWMFRLAYEGQRMGNFNSDKLVSVSPAKLQGFEANYVHYSSSRINRGDPALRPLFLRQPNVPCAKLDRRRSGRRGQGSLIDVATRQSQAAENSGLGHHSGADSSGQPAARRSISGKRDDNFRGPHLVQPEVPPRTEILPQTSQSQTSGEIRFCHKCGGNVRSSFLFCQFCGAKVKSQDL
eukprot:TRINITY_DN13003_c1_g1_i1.p1 TRINITY_DN13003_c1_g1~~TRINITY_DN13003_c1_g1_i1.p1  ORF type:complete len:519 (+),score=95.61 TRINITY_DN13003_c1_g1_i1:41-1597(+)